MLFHPSLRNQGRTLAVAVGADPLGLARNPSHTDISPVELLVHPPVFENVLSRKEAAKDDREHDEKNASASICARAFRLPR